MSTPCAHSPNCVGCALIGRPYGEQLRWKREAVRKAFDGHASLQDLDVAEVIGSPRPFGYRNQAKLVARRARRGLLLGIYRPGTHQVVDIRECPVHHPLIAGALPRVIEILDALRIPTYDERTHSGSLRYVVLRASQWRRQVQVILVTRQREVPRLQEVARRLRRLPGLRSVILNVNPEPGNVIFGPEFIALTRETELVERLGDLKLKTRPGAFLQANTAVARRMYECAVSWAAPGAKDVAADLYCGVGALTFFLARRAGTVFGIEESPLAVADAKANTRLNGFHNVRFHAGTVATVFPDLCGRLERLDVVTLNPPRKGVDAATRSALAGSGARCIIYVSCNPASLARDLDWFAPHGYRPSRVQPFDLLPQTEHVECVVELNRVRPG